MIEWIISTLAVFFIIFIMFQLDEKYAYGFGRDLLGDIWWLYLITLFIPIINIIACIVSVIVSVILIIREQMDDNNVTGDKILKKIFFIKDEN